MTVARVVIGHSVGTRGPGTGEDLAGYDAAIGKVRRSLPVAPVGRPIMPADQGAPPSGPPTPGMDRRQLLDHEDRRVGWVRTDAGMAGGRAPQP